MRRDRTIFGINPIQNPIYQIVHDICKILQNKNNNEAEV